MTMSLPFLFHVSHHSLVFAGFLAQALTGALNPLVVALGFGALGLSFFKEPLRVHLLLSRPMGNTVAVIALVFGLLDFLLFSRNLIVAAAHFLILIQIIKLFSLRDNKDYYQLYGLSFFGLVSAAGLTFSLSFIVSFLLYLLMLTWTLILHHFKEETEKAGLGTHTVLHTSGTPLLTMRFMMTVSLVALFAFAMTLAFFYAIPRVGFGYLRSRNDNRLYSGFSRTIDLGLFGPVKLDSQVVMRVQMPRRQASPGRTPIHWRGVALDHYDGRSWKSQAPFNRLAASRSGGSFQIREKTGDGRVVKQVFTVEPLNIDVIFSVPALYAVSGKFRYLKTNRMGTVEHPFFGEANGRCTYTVLSEVRLTRDGREIAGLGRPTEDESGSLLQVPEPATRLRRLTEQVVANRGSDYEKVGAIEQFLKKEYTYSLDVTRNPSETPLDDFLFFQKRGYCEHFATAMALMVRTLGVPARLVSGFTGGEWNDFGEYYLVRQKNAHTWVEVYFPDMGWITFDPTPTGDRQVQAFPLLTGLFQYLDALRWKWNRYVINYRLRDQITMVRMAHRRSIHLREIGEKILEVLKAQYRRWSGKRPPWQKTIVLLLAGIGVMWTVCLILRKWSPWARSPRGAKPQSTRVDFYRRMVKILEAKGFSRRQGTTPLEYADEVIRAGGQSFRGVLGITRLYNRHRFGKGRIAPAEMDQIRSKLRDLKSVS